MNKKIIIVLLAVFLNGLVYGNSTNQWKVILYPLQSKTENNREDSLKTVIQKSIQTFLSQVDYLSIDLNAKDVWDGISSYKAAYTNGYDISISGSYAVINEKIYIFIAAYDIVLKQVKFQKSYSGDAGVDIFDTIDQIVASLKQDITKTVKPFDEETLIKYRKRVELVTEDVQVPMSFGVSFGWINGVYDHYYGIPYLGVESTIDWFYFGASFFTPFIVPAENPRDNWDDNFVHMSMGYNFGDYTIGAGSFLFTTYIYSEPQYMAGYIENPPPFSPMIFFKYHPDLPYTLRTELAVTPFSSSGSIKYSGLGIIIGLCAEYYFLPQFGLKIELYNSSFSGEGLDASMQKVQVKTGNNLILLGLNYKVDLK